MNYGNRIVLLFELFLVISVTSGCFQAQANLPPLPKVRITDIKFNDDNLFKWKDDVIKPDEFTNLIFSVENADNHVVEDLH